jgi:hypothetical protein
MWRSMTSRRGTVAIARQIGADDSEVGREQWRNIAPHQMGLRKAMQQKERRRRKIVVSFVATSEVSNQSNIPPHHEYSG